MSDKKTNEILENQRKAHQEFLNLKKMQQGEMYAGPKPSEVATKLDTPKAKIANFWDYSKWFVIVGVLLSIAIAFMVAQCVNRPVYDLKVIYFTYTYAMDDQLKPIEEYLKPYCKDVDGDGEVNIQVINCSLSKDNANISMRNAVYQKLQALIVADENALLFITDKDAEKYFENIGEDSEGFFGDERVVLSEKFYEATKNDYFGDLPEGLTLSCRRVSDTLIEKQENVATYYEAAIEVVDGVISEKK